MEVCSLQVERLRSKIRKRATIFIFSRFLELSCLCCAFILSSLFQKICFNRFFSCKMLPFWKTKCYQSGVVNVVNGDGSTCVFLAEHMDVDKICFTGSSAVSHKIIEMSAASNMKRVTLELGGKSPMIVCDDADLDQAVAVAENCIFFNAGQCCCASSRLLVQDAIYDEFVRPQNVEV